MALDEDFPDHVVWRCEECEFRATPAMFREAWNDFDPKPPPFDKMLPAIRLIFYGVVIAIIIILFL